ncbi:MAG: prepilin-type N-terminal cleavage/methylation domain-containing protein [Phycisphaera sp.]|nr:prepilin-type N-terminal cleavage/methylation domain-containing protein [Phycisphaera sp.]
MTKPNRRPAGFTLVELLVVVTIITLLIALLLPALESARYTGRLVACKSNQRQIGTAFTAYAIDNRKWYPIRELFTGTGKWLPSTRSCGIDYVRLGPYTGYERFKDYRDVSPVFNKLFLCPQSANFSKRTDARYPTYNNYANTCEGTTFKSWAPWSTTEVIPENIGAMLNGPGGTQLFNQFYLDGSAYNNKRFNILASDAISEYPTGGYKTSNHIRGGSKLIIQTNVDRGAVSSYNGHVTINYLFTDGHVKEYGFEANNHKASMVQLQANRVSGYLPLYPKAEAQ